MNLSQVKTGARVRITTAAGQSGWSSNLILNAAKAIIAKGYTEEPNPVLGQSIIPVSPDQAGVQAPLTNMEVMDRKVVSVKQTRSNNTTVMNVTELQYRFKNNDTTTVNISEIGYAGLNRALFVDDASVAKAWPVAAGEEIIIEVEFTILTIAYEGRDTIPILDQDDQQVDEIMVTHGVITSASFAPNVWWNLLAPRGDVQDVILVTDSTWDGLTIPTTPGINGGLAKITQDERHITVKVDHTTTSTVGIYGYYLQNKGNTPPISVLFSKAVSIGTNYNFTSEVIIDW